MKVDPTNHPKKSSYHASPPEHRNHRAKDGALCTIGSISGILEKDPSFSPQLEGLLVAHVFPEANSQAPFLRARVLISFSLFFPSIWVSSQHGANLNRQPSQKSQGLLDNLQFLRCSILQSSKHLACFASCGPVYEGYRSPCQNSSCLGLGSSC